MQTVRTPDDPASEANRAAWTRLSTSDTPVLSAFSDGDPITAAWAEHIESLPGARGRLHPTITGAGHFLQEDDAAGLATAVTRLVAET